MDETSRCPIQFLLDNSECLRRRSLPNPNAPTPTPPARDIFIIDLKGEGKVKLGQPIKITSEAGYNNQPSFLGSAFRNPTSVRKISHR